jgi:hypothetical protein
VALLIGHLSFAENRVFRYNAILDCIIQSMQARSCVKSSAKFSCPGKNFGKIFLDHLPRFEYDNLNFLMQEELTASSLHRLSKSLGLRA